MDLSWLTDINAWPQYPHPRATRTGLEMKDRMTEVALERTAVSSTTWGSVSDSAASWRAGCCAVVLAALVAGAGCDDATPPTPTDAAAQDAGASLDSGATTDSGPPADTWGNFASEFVQTYCVACHSASPRDFNTLAEVRSNAAVARCGVSPTMLDGCGSWPPPRQFPVGSGPFPSDEDRTRFVEWLDAGAPE